MWLVMEEKREFAQGLDGMGMAIAVLGKDCTRSTMEIGFCTEIFQSDWKSIWFTLTLAAFSKVEKRNTNFDASTLHRGLQKLELEEGPGTVVQKKLTNTVVSCAWGFRIYAGREYYVLVIASCWCKAGQLIYAAFRHSMNMMLTNTQDSVTWYAGRADR